jgi:hypothetical protein
MKRRGRGGKPHWTEYRILLGEYQQKVVFDNLIGAWQEYLQENNIEECRFPSTDFWTWVEEQLSQIGGRVVYDMRIEGKAIQLDDDATKVAFLLRWGGAQ